MPDDQSSATFAALLRRHRLAAGLTQEALAERAGLGVRSVQGLERGETQPLRATAEHLAEGLRLGGERRAAFLAAARPAPRDRSAPPEPVAAQLPAPLSSFVGRERELAELATLLAPFAAGPRLLTLTGPGGVGKTRLALEVAAHGPGRFPDWVGLAELAPLADPALVPAAVAAALGIREQPGRPLQETLVQALRPRRLLLLLDNCEHLLDACVRLADALLRGCPGRTILATSREALAVAGEVVRRIPPLAAPPPGDLPPLERLADFGAVRLFLERARAVRPDIALTPRNAPAVAELCRRLDGIPLALELAAARVGVLAVEQLSAHLDQQFRLLTGGSRAALPRQRTLRAAVDWSYDLLSDRERALCRRLSAFAGGCTLEAVEAVGAGDGLAREDVLDLLARLVEQSLVIAEEQEDGATRYRLLEPLRQYAAERLAEAGEVDAIGDRHAAHFLALAEAAAPHLRGPQPSAQSRGPQPAGWQQRLAAEQDNLRAALRRLVGRADAELAQRLALILAGYCAWRGSIAEGGAHVQSVLPLARSAPPSGAAADVLARAGQLAAHLADYAAERAYREEALAFYRALGDQAGVADTLSLLGSVRHNLGDDVAAQAALDEALALHRSLRDREGMAHDLIRLGELAQDRGDFAAARRRYQESRAMGEALDDPSFAVRLPHHMGSLALEQGEVAPARGHFLTGLRRLRDHYLWFWLYSALADFADLAAAEGQPAHALRLAGALERVRETTGAGLQPAERRRLERWLAVARRALPEEAAAAAWAEGRALTLEEAISQALSMEAASPPGSTGPCPDGEASRGGRAPDGRPGSPSSRPHP